MTPEGLKKFVKNEHAPEEMFNMKNSEIEQHELDFSNPEDWRLFLESAEDIYADAMFYEPNAKAEEYKSLTFDDVNGEEIFTTMYHRLQILVDSIAEVNQMVVEDISDEQISKMQDLYDELVLLRNHVFDTYIISDYLDEEVSSSETSISESVLSESHPVELKQEEETELTAVVDIEKKEIEDSPTKPEEKEEPDINKVEETAGLQKLDEVVLEKVDDIKKVESLFESNLPVVGVDGIAPARVLREKLFSARDRDPLLIHDRTKQLATDKLIRFLSTIPKDGFSNEQVVSIENLARIIGFKVERLEPPQEKNGDVISGIERIDEAEDHPYFFEGQALNRKVMSIEDDNIDGQVTISVKTKVHNESPVVKEAKKSEPIILKTRIESSPTDSPSLVESLPASIVATVEGKDPINSAVKNRQPTIVRAPEVLGKTSLTSQYLNAERYQDFIKNNYSSPESFERMLDSVIAQIDSRSIDLFEKWLGEKFASPFAFMQDMTVKDIADFASSDDVRTILSKSNIKYESFVVWLDLIDDMLEVVDSDENITLGGLYSRWVIESEMGVDDNVLVA